jgi:hypothetical protein
LFVVVLHTPAGRPATVSTPYAHHSIYHSISPSPLLSVDESNTRRGGEDFDFSTLLRTSASRPI